MGGIPHVEPLPEFEKLCGLPDLGMANTEIIMARPRKLDTDDRYNEEALNLGETDVREKRYDIDDEMLPELGETNRTNSFDRLTDAVAFGGLDN
jgi:hypothetical protein